MSRLANAFSGALTGLDAQPTDDVVERLAVLVHECMSGRGRSFHDVEHALDIASSSQPLQVLAGLFHDVVYHQIDGGFVAETRRLVGNAVTTMGNETRLSEPDPNDAVLNDVIRVFGFAPGQLLTVFGGLNEFSSALVAARLLAPLLDRQHVLSVAAIIEATIPFRRPGPDGGPLDVMFKRLQKLGFSEDAAARTMFDALGVVNRDVGNFAYLNSAEFLDHTWMLLPESNWSLRNNSAYTLSEYRIAIEKMERFLSALPAELVFSSFRGSPNPATLDALTEGARRNIFIGSRYLRAKCVAARTLESLALLTGGDAPVSLLMGDLPDARFDTIRIEDFLGPPPYKAKDTEPEVQALLTHGRASETTFDLKHAPLAAYLYEALGDAEIDRVLEALRGGKSALEAVPIEVVAPVLRAISEIAPTRRRRLLALIGE